MANKVTMTSNEIRREVFRRAHKEYKKKTDGNIFVWSFILCQTWCIVKQEIAGIKKAVTGNNSYDIFAGMDISAEEASRMLGYGCGRYCGD